MNSQTSSGVSVFTVLGIIFVVLKLVGVIAWSWWWVLAPFWVPFVVGLVLLAIIGIFIFLFEK